MVPGNRTPSLFPMLTRVSHVICRPLLDLASTYELTINTAYGGIDAAEMGLGEPDSMSRNLQILQIIVQLSKDLMDWVLRRLLRGWQHRQGCILWWTLA